MAKNAKVKQVKKKTKEIKLHSYLGISWSDLLAYSVAYLACSKFSSIQIRDLGAN